MRCDKEMFLSVYKVVGFVSRCRKMRARNFIIDMLRRLRRDESGDVLLEYVLVTVVIVLPLVGASTYLFDPDGTTFDVEGALDGENFGLLGEMFVDFYRMVMSGLSLPLP